MDFRSSGASVDLLAGDLDDGSKDAGNVWRLMWLIFRLATWARHPGRLAVTRPFA